MTVVSLDPIVIRHNLDNFIFYMKIGPKKLLQYKIQIQAEMLKSSA